MILLTAEDYLKLVEKWEDPNPLPIITMHDNIFVVRDDLLGGGSKMRFIDHMIKTWPYKEFVYGSSPATGYAQISFAKVAAKYGKKAVIFMAQRDMNKLHPYQQEAIISGADMRWIPNGMLSVTEKRARDYVKEDPTNRVLIPIGGDHVDVLACIIKVARYNIGMIPDEVWSVGSSGTLTRGLQLAWPNAKFNVVSVGHKGNYGNAKIYNCDIPFNKPSKILPPFPSAPTYDAKAWEFIMKYSNKNLNKTIMFWNVGA